MVVRRGSMKYLNNLVNFLQEMPLLLKFCRMIFHIFYFVGFVGTRYDHQSYKLGGDFVSSQEKWSPTNFIFSPGNVHNSVIFDKVKIFKRNR